METDQLLMMGVVCVIVYMAGYRPIAIGLFIIMVLATVIMPEKKAVSAAAAGGVKVHGAEMLEPIIIETTKGAPFRIPAKMKIRMNPYWGASPWHVKLGKNLGRILRFGYIAGGLSSSTRAYPTKKK